MNALEVFLKFFTKLQLDAQSVLLRIMRAEVEHPQTQLAIRIKDIVGGSLMEHVAIMHGLVVYSAPIDDVVKALTVYELTNGDEGLRVLDCHTVDDKLVFGVADGPMRAAVAEHGQALLAMMNRVMIDNAERFV